MILALDTAGAELVVCLLDDTLQVGASRVVSGPRHQDVVLEVVKELLGDGAAAGSLDAIAVVRGPGSQTGLRVGLSTAEGMAYGGRLPLLPLSSLAVASHRFAGQGAVVALVSAGRTNVYAQCAAAGGGLVGDRVLCSLTGMTAALPGAEGIPCVGEATLMARVPAAGLVPAEPVREPGEALAVAAREALNAGALLAYHQLTGDYGES